MSQKRALVLGGTGAVGSALVRELLNSESWASVQLLSRKPTELFSTEAGLSKLLQRNVDLAQGARVLDDVEGNFDAVFCTMGIGQPRKIGRELQWLVEVDQTYAFAQACHKRGVKHFSHLTSVGADAKSKFFYLRLKGVIEEKISGLNFERASFFRPSLLVTPKLRYGMQDRVTQWLFPKLSLFLRPRYHEIKVEDLGRAMRLNAEKEAGSALEILEYPEFAALLA
jgi:uncharacterized protein YbjT (DUF2867 family)